MIDLIRLHIPGIIQRKTKYVYTAKYCPFCKPTTNSNVFRVNLKLKVFKCYNCGRGGKTINKFLYYIKKQKKNGYRAERHNLMSTFEVHYGCETYGESQLPF